MQSCIIAVASGEATLPKHCHIKVIFMEIRLAQASDIPELLNLLLQVGDVHHRIRPDIFRPDAQKYTHSALWELMQDNNRPIFVAMEGEKMLGYCFCVLKDSQGSTVLTDRVELYIDDLCVDKSCRSMGVGKQLYRHTLAYAKEIGCAFVTLNVWCGNDSAMAFYENLGLKPRSIIMEVPLEET